jgi:hypothetical protein
MTDARDAKGEDSGHAYVRLPWPLVAAGLFGVLVLVLAAGLFANRYLRPQVGLVPTEVPLAAPPASTPLTVAAVTSTVAATSTPGTERTPLIIFPPAATPEPTTLPTPSVAPTAAASLSAATPRPTVSPELAAEVGDAYKQYWEIRAEALFALDTSRLQDVMAGDHLVAVERFISELQSEHHAIQTEVDHNYAIVRASQDEAEIADTYTDSSVYVDAMTHQIIGSPTNDVLREQYRMNRIDGTWRVVSLVRAP